MTQPAHVRQPTPEEFGISAARARYFRRVLGEDWVAAAAIGAPILAASLVGFNWVLPRGVAGSLDPVWRFLLPIVPGAGLVAVIQHWRKAAARKREDFGKFAAYEAARQRYVRALSGVPLARPRVDYEELARVPERAPGPPPSEPTRHTPRSAEDAELELEVVQILTGKGYDVGHVSGGGSGAGRVDFAGNFDGRRIVGWCHGQQGYVSAGQVQELYEAMQEAKGDEGWLVGRLGFSSGARVFAIGKGIRLFTVEEVKRLPAVPASKVQSSRFKVQSP